MTETRQQQELMAWLKRTYPVAWSHTFHPPNGGNRSQREGGEFKLMGVKPGVPDLMCVLAAGGYRGLAVELKTDTGSASDAQLEWIERLDGQNWKTAVVHSLAAGKTIFDDYMRGSWVASLSGVPVAQSQRVLGKRNGIGAGL